MTVDVNEHAKEQRLNARLEYLEKKVELLLGSFIAITRVVVGPDTAAIISETFESLVNEHNSNLSDIAEAARPLRELEND